MPVAEDQERLLTPREMQVARMVADGEDNIAIAEALSISIETVKNHIYRACNKTGMGNRVELANWLWRREREEYERVIAELRAKIAV